MSSVSQFKAALVRAATSTKAILRWSQHAPTHVEPVRWRELDMGLVLDGRAGETLSVSIPPQCAFRVEKMLAADSGGANDSEDGTRTKIVQVFVGAKNQIMPVLGKPAPMLTKMFTARALGNGWMFDICYPGQSITFHILFLVDCRWESTLFGKAVG